MIVEVLSRLGQTLSRRLSGSSLFGDGMLVRLRSTTIGLLGLVAAVGLGLIAFISQQGWPGVFSGPLPVSPAPRVVHNDTITLVRPVRRVPVRDSNRPPPDGVMTQAPGTGVPAPSVDSELAGSDQAGTPTTDPAVHPAAAHPGPGPQGSPSPAPTATPAPTAARAPAPEPPAVPVLGEPEDDSPGHSGESPGHSGDPPGHSGESHGNSLHTSGPPAWAGNDGEDSPGRSGEHGKPDWAGH